eukprot:TRINITY_DN48171_c0_g1_i1.p1 TRINITY_DN48171_c0_g1~~TRINITY_DN48171_c0_g1_i1.p1  ORF type:complete len:219 (-),score=46.61 TRINITY_DN48171_c0_g1_i1:211-867(-)
MRLEASPFVPQSLNVQEDAAEMNFAFAPTPTVTSASLPPITDQGDAKTPEELSEQNSSDELEVPTTPAVASSKPRYVHSLQMSQLNWDKLATQQEWRTTLQLRGLPRKLCEKGMLEALLRSSGLVDSIASIKAKSMQGRGIGSATIRVKSVSEVASVAKFFHGRQFSGSAMPVSVSFAEESFRARGQGMKVALLEPRHISPQPCQAILPPPGLEHLCF